MQRHPRQAMPGWRRPLTVAAVAIAAVAAIGGHAEAADNPSDTPANGHASNLGVCSPFLGQAHVRPAVNELVRDLGPFLPDGPYDNVGELYRIRAQEKPTAGPIAECVAR